MEHTQPPPVKSKPSLLSPLQIQIIIPFLLVALIFAAVGATAATFVIANRWGTLPGDWFSIALGLFTLLFALMAGAVLIIGYMVTAPLVRQMTGLADRIDGLSGGIGDETPITPRINAALNRQRAHIQWLETSLNIQREEYEHLYAALSSFPDAVLIFDQTGKLTSMNWAAEDRFGSEAAFWRTAFGALVKEIDLNDPFLVYRRVNGSDGETFDGEASPVITEQGDITGLTLVVRDVSQTVSIDKRKDTFIARLVDELQAPVAEVAHDSEMLTQLLPTYPFVENIYRNAKLMRALAAEVRDIVAIRQNKLALKRHIISLESLLSNALHNNHFDDRFRAAGIELQNVVLEPHLRVQADPVRLRTALYHLFDNVIEYTPKGGTVTVSMGKLGEGYAVIDIADTGVGIPADELPYIFDAYYQGTTASPSGLGLGLFIARAIAEAHGGRLSATSEPGKGSTFSLVLPLATV